MAEIGWQGGCRMGTTDGNWHDKRKRHEMALEMAIPEKDPTPQDALG
jgi:hypothetical protein